VKLVVKLSGKVLEREDLRRGLTNQVATLTAAGHQLLLVHGAGKQLTEFCRSQDIPVVQIQGRRVTDARTQEAAKLVFRGVNADLTAGLVAAAVPAVGISGFDGGLTRSRRRPPLLITEPGSDSPGELIDFGFVGEIEEVNARLITHLWDAGFVPVICSLCAGPDGDILNINADTLATELALGVKADRLVSVSDVDGILRDAGDPRSRIERMRLAEARTLLAEGVFQGGMIPKVETAMALIERGVPEFQVISGLSPDALARCLDPHPPGTLLVLGC
jgi:acetylglutamate kinase